MMMVKYLKAIVIEKIASAIEEKKISLLEALKTVTETISPIASNVNKAILM